MYGVGRDQPGPLLSVVGSGWTAFWLVSLALSGAILAWRPAIFLWSDNAGLVRIVGVILCLGVAAMLVWIGEGRNVIWRRMRLEFLSRRLTLWQMLAAVVDIVASGLVFYLFLPADLAGDLAGFMAVFVVAVGLGILSHIPGGLGSFETTIMIGLGTTLEEALIEPIVSELRPEIAGQDVEDYIAGMLDGIRNGPPSDFLTWLDKQPRGESYYRIF